MTGVVTALAAPLRTLLDSVGCGNLPADGPQAALRSSAHALELASHEVGRFTAAVPAVWESTSADAARAMVDSHRAHLTGLADDARDVAAIVDEAATVVAGAATALRGLLDSFTAAADALGPAITQPAGLLAVVALAADHLTRALDVVGQARVRLTSLRGRAEAVAHRRTPALPDVGRIRRPAPHRGVAMGEPADAAATGAATRSASAGGVAITLPDGSIAHAPNERAATAVRAALSQRGVPYVWGGTSPGRGLDCSGLTQYAYRQAGVELPRLAQDQDTAGFRVDQGELLPGDLAVWSGHVAMVIGNGQMVEAGDPVSVSAIRTSNAGQTFEGFFRPR